MPNKIHLDLEKVKDEINNGKYINQISKIFGVHRYTMSKILKENNISPNKPKHSDEVKRKLSIIRKNFLNKNPDKHPWRSNNKFKSIPCEKVKEWLISKNIKFIPEYNELNIKDKYYSLDIAFPDKMIGIEINGNQHYNRDGTLKEYYQKRHDIIQFYGWKLIELHYSIAFHINDFEKIINQLLNIENKTGFNYDTYINPIIKPSQKKKSSIHLKKYNYPSYEVLKKLYSQLTLKNISIKLNIPISALASKLNRYNIKKIGISARDLTETSSLEETCDIHFHHGDIKNLTPNSDWRNLPRPNHRKVIRPDKLELETLIQKFPMTTLSKKFGVSDNAIRKWCKCYGINLPNRQGYWTKLYNKN